MQQPSEHNECRNAQDAGSQDARRRSGRLEQELLFCEYGRVQDLSVGGMRVASRRVPAAGVLDVSLFGVGETISLKARVAWKRRTGLLKHEVGFQFVDVSPELARKLTNLATTCRMRRAL